MQLVLQKSIEKLVQSVKAGIFVRGGGRIACPENDHLNQIIPEKNLIVWFKVNSDTSFKQKTNTEM